MEFYGNRWKSAEIGPGKGRGGLGKCWGSLGKCGRSRKCLEKYSWAASVQILYLFIEALLIFCLLINGVTIEVPGHFVDGVTDILADTTGYESKSEHGLVGVFSGDLFLLTEEEILCDEIDDLSTVLTDLIMDGVDGAAVGIDGNLKMSNSGIETLEISTID